MKRMLMSIVVAIVALSVVGCASLPLKQKLAVTFAGSVDALAAFQTTERNLYKTKLIKGLTPQLHETISNTIGKAADAQIKAADALLAWRAGDPVPTTVTQTLNYGQEAFDEVVILIPKLKGVTPQERQLVDALRVWLNQLVSIAKSLNVAVPAWAQ